MLRLAFDFIITWRETRTRPNAYKYCIAIAFVMAIWIDSMSARLSTLSTLKHIGFYFCECAFLHKSDI